MTGVVSLHCISSRCGLTGDIVGARGSDAVNAVGPEGNLKLRLTITSSSFLEAFLRL